MSHWSQRQTKQSYQQPNQFFFCITDTEIWTRKVDNCLSMNRDRKCCMLNLRIPSHWLTELFCFWVWKQTNCHENFIKVLSFLSPPKIIKNKQTNKNPNRKHHICSFTKLHQGQFFTQDQSYSSVKINLLHRSFQNWLHFWGSLLIFDEVQRSITWNIHRPDR